MRSEAVRASSSTSAVLKVEILELSGMLHEVSGPPKVGLEEFPHTAVRRLGALAPAGDRLRSTLWDCLHPPGACHPG